MTEMISEIATRGYANKSKPLMERKYSRGSGVWGVRVAEGV